MANHANNAVVAGATKSEIFDAAAIGIEFGGGPSFAMVRDEFLYFLDAIEQTKQNPS